MEDSGDLFSLEDDDYNEMFITQVPKVGNDGNKNSEVLEKEVNDGMILGLARDDFQSPCSSLINRKESGIYSDISEAEDDFEMKNLHESDR